MSLLTVVQDVCAVVGVDVPTSVFSNISANRTMQEMVALANEMALRIAFDTREWRQLKEIGAYVADGVTTTFALPPNFRRFLVTSNIYSTVRPTQPMRYVPDTDEWLRRRLANETNANGEFTLLGSNILFYPAPPAGFIEYVFMQKYIILPDGGGLAERFTADGDTYRLDERLLKLGMIWQWKAQKGSPYAEDMGTYGDALQMAMGADRPAPIIVGRTPISANARIAYPWPVPTP